MEFMSLKLSMVLPIYSYTDIGHRYQSIFSPLPVFILKVPFKIPQHGVVFKWAVVNIAVCHGKTHDHGILGGMRKMFQSHLIHVVNSPVDSISLTRLPNFASWGYLTPHLPKGVLIIGLAPCQAYCIWSDVRTYMYVSYICVYAHSHLYVHVGMNKQTHPRWQKHTATCNMSHVPCRSIPAPRWASPTRKPRTPRNQSTSTNTTAVDGAAKTPWLLSQIFASPRHVGHLKGWELETTENSTQDVHISPSMRDIRVGFHGARICDWRSWSMNGGCKAIFCNFCGFSNPIFGVCENGSRSQQLLCLPRT